jgi:hypothetical protein
MSLSNELEHDERTDWLRGCGWLRWFAQKPLYLIIATSRLATSTGEAIHLSTWNSVEWISSAATESKLRQLLRIVHLVLDRCEETLEQTPRVLRCWLRSWGYPLDSCGAVALCWMKSGGGCRICSARSPNYTLEDAGPSKFLPSMTHHPVYPSMKCELT